jgi:hypothetical protein
MATVNGYIRLTIHIWRDDNGYLCQECIEQEALCAESFPDLRSWFDREAAGFFSEHGEDIVEGLVGQKPLSHAERAYGVVVRVQIIDYGFAAYSGEHEVETTYEVAHVQELSLPQLEEIVKDSRRGTLTDVTIASWPVETVSGGKRANIENSGYDWFVGYGKDQSCVFEGTWWDMICFARNVLASENTLRAAPEFHMPELKNDNYTGPTPYTFLED